MVINIPAPAQATRVAPVPPAAASMRLALAHHLILGAVAPAPAILFTNTLAPVPAIPAVQALLATANTPPAPAPLATNGRTALVQY